MRRALLDQTPYRATLHSPLMSGCERSLNVLWAARVIRHKTYGSLIVQQPQ
jgi:hypothetical protein